MESKMKKIFAFNAIAVATLAGAAFLITAEPAAAKDYEFCKQDFSSAPRLSCAYDTMEQCVAMISGRSGTCTRNPFLAEASDSYAYASKRQGHKNH
jgi:Protein of unknown function (DUF3551)